MSSNNYTTLYLIRRNAAFIAAGIIRANESRDPGRAAASAPTSLIGDAMTYKVDGFYEESDTPASTSATMLA